MTKHAQPDSNDNRRNYFRVNHDVIFECRSVDTYCAAHGEPESAFDDSTATGLTAELRRIDREAAKTLKALADRDPILSNYLHLLTKKVDLVARHTLVAAAMPEPHGTKRINLSESGLAFNSDKAFYKGKFLAIRLLFLPSYVPMTAFAEVVRCQSKPTEDGQETYHVAARFHRLPSADRQELTRQIMKAQVAHRRKAPASKPNPGEQE